jgi:hypothetical protein
MTGPRHNVFPCRYHLPSSLHRHRTLKRLSQPPGLALRLEQAEDVVLADCAKLVSNATLHATGVSTWALDVADDAAGCVVHELDADLGNTTAGACPESILPFPDRFHLSRPSISDSKIRYVPVRPRTMTIMLAFAIFAPLRARTYRG